MLETLGMNIYQKINDNKKIAISFSQVTEDVYFELKEAFDRHKEEFKAVEEQDILQ